MRRRNTCPLILVFLFLIAQCLTIVPARAAQLFTWTGSGDGYKWNDRFNWNPNNRAPNTDGDIAQIGGAAVQVYAPALASELQLGATGTVTIGNNQTLYLTSSTGDATAFNSGTIRIDAGASTNAAALDCKSTRLTFQGGGKVLLGGTQYDIMKNSVAGGRFVNATGHTIQGGGRILSVLFNQGQVLADHGTLALEKDVYNTGGSLLASGGSNILELWGTITGGNIIPQDGTVNLRNASCRNVSLGSGQVTVQYSSSLLGNSSLPAGAQLTVNGGMLLRLQESSGAFSLPNTITNAGTILLDGCSPSLFAHQQATLTGPGRLVLGGDLTAYVGDDYLEEVSYINDTSHTIEGGGQIDAMLLNKGTIKANNGKLEIDRKIYGDGAIAVFDNATLEIYGADVQTGNFSMSNLANLTVQHTTDGGSIDLKKDFTFNQTDAAKWNWANYTYLQGSGGGPWQSLEVGGKNWGAVNTGFSNNFNLPKLVVTGTRVYLLDAIDNGHRSSGKPEALYVDELKVDPGATLNLNRLSLYTKLGGFNHRVVAGEGDLFGGGQIIDKSVKPATEGNVLLLLLLDG